MKMSHVMCTSFCKEDVKYLGNSIPFFKYVNRSVTPEYIEELSKLLDEKKYLFMDCGNVYFEIEKVLPENANDTLKFAFAKYNKYHSEHNCVINGIVFDASSFEELFEKLCFSLGITQKPVVIPEEDVSQYRLEHPIFENKDTRFCYDVYSIKSGPEEEKEKENISAPSKKKNEFGIER